MTTTERFMAKVDVGNSPAGCWMWMGHRNDQGYGVFYEGGLRLRAHRIAYSLLIVDGASLVYRGTDLDHLCREPGCVNPLHLEPVTHRENMVRGIRPRVNAAKTHCPAGHAYNKANTYVAPNGWRTCRTCRRAHDRARAKNALLGWEDA